MRRKVSTVLEESLFRRAKLESVRQGRQVSEIIGEALERYLDSSGSPRGSGGAVASSWASLRVHPRKVRQIVEEEDEVLGD
jgi:hypothetical protein